MILYMWPGLVRILFMREGWPGKRWKSVFRSEKIQRTRFILLYFRERRAQPQPLGGRRDLLLWPKRIKTGIFWKHQMHSLPRPRGKRRWSACLSAIKRLTCWFLRTMIWPLALSKRCKKRKFPSAEKTGSLLFLLMR